MRNTQTLCVMTDSLKSCSCQLSDWILEDESDIDHGVFPLISVVVTPVLRLCLQLDYLNSM